MSTAAGEPTDAYRQQGWPPRPTPCRDCGAPVLWARTAKGRALCVDVDVSDRGNVLVSLYAGELHAGVLGPVKAAAARKATGLRLAHAADGPGPRGAAAVTAAGRNRARPHELPRRAYPVKAP